MSRFSVPAGEEVGGDDSALRISLMTLVVLLAIGAAWRDLNYIRKHPQKADRAEGIRRLTGVKTPILAEDPLLPVAMNQKAYMLDPFMYRVLQMKDSRLRQTLEDKLQKREFGAIVLFDDPRTPGGRDLFRSANFGEDFLSELENSYQLS